ncbi:MAG: DUF1572 family protein [Flavobacteriaceae bacterium]|nr:DUF1572 family protein [Flavobacteriaceae bacterium]
MNRQLTYYVYYIGQIVFMGKMITKNQWKHLSKTVARVLIFSRDLVSFVYGIY